ncbi:hypothetical protein CRG98_039562 [Punica granatum]|uniref:Uncharacterized protein n=1 Tax=Punica granatum TaxID=22663 RepID=A0A2I0I7T6_PUNGR|nr:hypothetical protein CRG98_039562 [Punica granatum]
MREPMQRGLGVSTFPRTRDGAREKESPLPVYDPKVEGRQLGLLGSGPNWAEGLDWADGVELGRVGCWAERTAEPNWAGLWAGLGRAGLDWA